MSQCYIINVSSLLSEMAQVPMKHQVTVEIVPQHQYVTKWKKRHITDHSLRLGNSWLKLYQRDSQCKLLLKFSIPDSIQIFSGVFLKFLIPDFIQMFLGVLLKFWIQDSIKHYIVNKNHISMSIDINIHFICSKLPNISTTN